jgi:hypothetical protein
MSYCFDPKARPLALFEQGSTKWTRVCILFKPPPPKKKIESGVSQIVEFEVTTISIFAN